MISNDIETGAKDSQPPRRRRIYRRSTSTKKDYKHTPTGIVDLESSEFQLDLRNAVHLDVSMDVSMDADLDDISEMEDDDDAAAPSWIQRVLGARSGSSACARRANGNSNGNSNSNGRGSIIRSNGNGRSGGKNRRKRRGSVTFADMSNEDGAAASNPIQQESSHQSNRQASPEDNRPDGAPTTATATTTTEAAGDVANPSSKLLLHDYIRNSSPLRPSGNNNTQRNNKTQRNNNNNGNGNKTRSPSFYDHSDNISRSTRRDTILDAAGILHNSFEARSVAILRWVVLLVWIASACVVSFVFVNNYAQDKEYDEFQASFRTNADKIITTFDAVIDSKLNAINSLATAITTYAAHTNDTFPFLTIPDFVMAGANTRIMSDASIIHWLPLVQEHQRQKWQQYAYQNRFQINRAYDQDAYFRTRQDVELGYLDAQEGADKMRQYQGWETRQYENPPLANMTIENNMVQDGTRYHPELWIINNGTRLRPPGSGPYLPLWQRSPVNSARQFTLNLDLAVSRGLKGIFPYQLEKKDKGVLLHSAMIPDPEVEVLLNDILLHSQFRHDGIVYAGDTETKISYPVYDGFGEDSNFVGVLSSSIYWRLSFTNVLPAKAKGYIVVMENKQNQVFSYKVDGRNVTFLGSGDPRERYGSDYIFDTMGVQAASHSANLRPKQETHAYTTLPIDTEFNTYTITIYPTQETLDVFQTDEPIFYTLLVAAIFGLAAVIFLTYDFCVQRRQHIIASKAVDNAKKAAVAERDLNEYIAHEVRNPLSAALSACSFVSSAVNQSHPLSDDEAKQMVREDVQIINSSLSFVNELLRNLLDLHRATDRQIRIRKRQTDIFDEILKPVASILYRRDDGFQLIVESFPRRLLVNTDSLRLKQVLLNLGRNASKFVNNGFLRLRAELDGEEEQQSVKLYVEDSGPGIPVENRKYLFSKFQESLDVTTQGSGIGLCLCKNLLDIMGGDIWLDESYDSGIPGQPGTRFVVDLKVLPMQPCDGATGRSLEEDGSMPGEEYAIGVVSNAMIETCTDDDANGDRHSVVLTSPVTCDVLVTHEKDASTATTSQGEEEAAPLFAARQMMEDDDKPLFAIQQAQTDEGPADDNAPPLFAIQSAPKIDDEKPASAAAADDKAPLFAIQAPPNMDDGETEDSPTTADMKPVAAPLFAIQPSLSPTTDIQVEDEEQASADDDNDDKPAMAPLVAPQLPAAQPEHGEREESARTTEDKPARAPLFAMQPPSRDLTQREQHTSAADDKPARTPLFAIQQPPQVQIEKGGREEHKAAADRKPIQAPLFAMHQPPPVQIEEGGREQQRSATTDDASKPARAPLFGIQQPPPIQMEQGGRGELKSSSPAANRGQDGCVGNGEQQPTQHQPPSTQRREQPPPQLQSPSTRKTQTQTQMESPTKMAARESHTIMMLPTQQPSFSGLLSPSTPDTEKVLPEQLSVLFVDDDRVLRKLFARCVRRALPGWTIKEAPDGETALEMVETNDTFGLIFMDQYMSTTEKKLLGTETVLELRRRGIKTKICGLSANDVEDDFLAVGADAFICKPFSFDKKGLRREISGVMFSQSGPK